MPHILSLPLLCPSFLHFFLFPLLSHHIPPSLPSNFSVLLILSYPSLFILPLLRSVLFLQDLNLTYSKGEAASLPLLHS